MTFQYPYLLILIPIIFICLLLFFLYSVKQNQIKLKLFIGNNNFLIPQHNKKISNIKFILQTIAIMLIVVALSRPQKGFIWQETVSTGIDIVIAVDTSKSMDAADVKPSRLERAKMALLELGTNLNGDRIALIPFAGSSFVMTPFTADYNVFSESVISLNTTIIPKGGTNLQSAIITSSELFKKNNSNKILILITDGEDLANQGINEAKKAAESGIQIFTVGVGTNQGELIPNSNKPGDFLKDRKGNIVKSRLDEDSLRNIAEITGGDYRSISSGRNGILEIYREKLSELNQEQKEEKRSRIPIDLYRWFLLPAILLLIIEFLISNFKTFKERKKKGLLFILFLTVTSNIFSTPADDALKNNNIEKAIELYSKEKENTLTLYNNAIALYRNGEFNLSTEKFKKSLNKASGDFQKKILYNLGNSLYKQSLEIDDINEKINILEESLESYRGSMSIGNSDDQVQKNYDFVKEILDKLKEQNQDQQNQDQQNQDQQNQDQQNQDQQNQDQQNQDQQNQDQQNQDQQNQDQQNQDQQNQDQQNQDQQNQDQQNQDQQNQDQQNQDQQNQDQQNQDQQNQAMTKDQAEALLKSLENEEVDLKYLLNNNDNSYTGEW